MRVLSFAFAGLEVCQLFALGGLIGCQRILATGGVGEQLVGGDSGGVECHQHGRALRILGQVSNAIIVQHIDDPVDAVSRAGAHDSGGAVNVFIIQ